MRIGVIGAGISGLTATWLLNEEHEVHLFEKKDSLGGHAHSITVPWAGHALTVDPGAQNFSTQMYPCFLELLRILGVQTQFTPMRIVLSWLTEPKELLLTPTGNFWELRHSICPAALSAQLWLAAAIWRAAAIKSWDVTVQDFIGQLNAPPPFVTDILTPFLSMMLGTPKSETHRASLRAAMVYPVLHRPANPLKPFNMLSVPSGVKTYIDTLAARLNPARVYAGAANLRVTKDAGGYRIDQDGRPSITVDHLVLATAARDALPLIAGLPGRESLTELLGKIEYIDTQVAVHSDVSYMPRDRRLWSEWNIQNQPVSSEWTMWVGRGQNAPVFKSWIFHKTRRPYSIHRTYDYHHPFLSPAYYRVQKALRGHHGHGNLWLAGSYLMHFDSHESAVRSALSVARALSPRARHLSQLAGAAATLSLD